MRRKRRPPQKQIRVRVNGYIRVPEVFLIDQNQEKLGVMPTTEAMKMAREAGLDLIEVSPNAKPPVAKILDFGKYKYDQTKALSRAKKNQKDSVVKEIRLGFKIDDHDFDVKARRAEKFLKEGNKVKVAVMFRGREIVHSDLGNALLNRFIDRLDKVAKIEQAPMKQGRSIHTILVSRPNAKSQTPQGNSKAD